jgi:hypothetical protein
MVKKRENISKSRYFHKVNSHNKIEDLTAIFKEFLRDVTNVKYEYTFKEIENIINHKHIPPQAKEKIMQLCENFEKLEFRPKKPAINEINNTKALFKQIITEILPKEGIREKKTIMDNLFKKVKFAQKSMNKAKVKTENSRKEKVRAMDIIEKKIKQRILERTFDSEKDLEYKELLKFIITSLDTGIKMNEIKKELKNMGFDSKKIDLAAKEIHA